jgi:hypothetical protein
MRKLVLGLAALALAVPMAPAAAGDVPALHNETETVSWPGRAYTTADVPVPDTFDFEIALPDGYWTTHEGGVEVAVRWESEYNTFDLYVLNVDNLVVASATGFPTSAESLILSKPPNGLYRVVVVPQIQVDDAYEGIAQVELKTLDQGGLKPDLVPLQPDNFQINSRTYSFTPIDNPLGSCYPEEQIELGVTRCLRFDSAVANFGKGPFELSLDIATLGSEDQDVFQDIYDRDGLLTSHEYAGGYTFHATHGHIHYQNFATYTLYRWENNALGEIVGTSRKADFCMIDTRLLWFGEPRGNGPRNHHFPNCNVPGSEAGAEATVMRQGIDVGWADVYTFDLPGQFIDISDPDEVPDGDYAVVVEVNPDEILTEISTTNNVGVTPIHIEGNMVTPLA